MKWTKRHTKNMEYEIQEALEERANELEIDVNDLDYLEVQEITDYIRGVWQWDYEVNNGNEY